MKLCPCLLALLWACLPVVWHLPVAAQEPSQSPPLISPPGWGVLPPGQAGPQNASVPPAQANTELRAELPPEMQNMPKMMNGIMQTMMQSMNGMMQTMESGLQPASGAFTQNFTFTDGNFPANLASLTGMPSFFGPPAAVAGPNSFLADANRYPIASSFQMTANRSVRGQYASLAELRSDTNLGFPIYMGDGGQILVGTLGLRYVALNTNAILPRSGTPIPDNLYEVRTGLFYRQVLNNGWALGLNVGIGSASDRPFHSIREIAPSAVATLNMPRDNGDAWVASLTYLPLGLLPFPIPGLAYNFMGENYDVMLGVPFDIRWRFTDNWSFEFGWLPVRRFRSQLTWQPDPKLAIFAGFDWTNDNYLLADRNNRNDFLFIFEKRASVGLRLRPADRVTLDFVAGYAFDRNWFQGDGYEDKHVDGFTVAPSVFGLARIGISF